MKKTFFLLTSCAAIGAIGLAAYTSSETPPAKARQAGATFHDAPSGTTAAAFAAPVQSGWNRSPFAQGGPARGEPLAERIARRKANMQAKGIDTLPEYHLMDLAALHALAKRGDMFAMLQLAEQYDAEVDALEADPGFDVKQAPPVLAKKFLADAVAAGHNHSAALLAKQYADEHNLVEAYAWHLMSERVGETGNVAAFQQSNLFGKLSPEQRRAAEQKSDALYQRKLQRFATMGLVGAPR